MVEYNVFATVVPLWEMPFLCSSLFWVEMFFFFFFHIINSTLGEYCVQSQNDECAMFLQSIAEVQRLASALSH